MRIPCGRDASSVMKICRRCVNSKKARRLYVELEEGDEGVVEVVEEGDGAEEGSDKILFFHSTSSSDMMRCAFINHIMC